MSYIYAHSSPFISGVIIVTTRSSRPAGSSVFYTLRLEEDENKSRLSGQFLAKSWLKSKGSSDPSLRQVFISIINSQRALIHKSRLCLWSSLSVSCD